MFDLAFTSTERDTKRSESVTIRRAGDLCAKHRFVRGLHEAVHSLQRERGNKRNESFFGFGQAGEQRQARADFTRATPDVFENDGSRCD
jgi:hypothetical protein